MPCYLDASLTHSLTHAPGTLTIHSLVTVLRDAYLPTHTLTLLTHLVEERDARVARVADHVDDTHVGRQQPAVLLEHLEVS